MISNKSKTYHPPVAATRGKPTTGANRVLSAAFYAFICGVGSALLLLSALALLLAKTSLPLTLVKPFSGGAACMGAMISGLVFAACIGKNKLVCGLCCGLFYAACLVIAGLAMGTFSAENANLLTLGMLIGCGVVGGAVSAAGNIGAAPANG